MISCARVCPSDCSHLFAIAALLASRRENVHVCILCVQYSLSLLMLEQRSAWLPMHFPATELWSPASRDSSFPFYSLLPPLICVSVLFMFLLGEKPRRPCRKEHEAYDSTGDLREMNEGFKVRGGFGRRRGLSEMQSGSWAVSIRLFPLILNCSHWKTVTSS